MNAWLDLKYAFRLLAGKPSFTALTILIMAVGLGLSIYNYSFIYGTALKELPFKDGDRIVSVNLQEGPMTFNGNGIAPAAFRYVSDRQQSFEILSYRQDSYTTISAGDRASRHSSSYITPEFFRILNIQPMLGREFTVQDSINGGRPVAIISDKLWRDLFGMRDDIIGHSTLINGKDTEIVGVMPEGFRFPDSKHVWQPSTIDLSLIGKEVLPNIAVYGLLKEGVSMESATADMAEAFQSLKNIDQEINRNQSMAVLSMQVAFMGSGIENVFVGMTVATIFILLLASINVANLLFSRAQERSKETAIRAALGAPSYRLVMQMMLESLIICAVGGVFAFLLATLGGEVTEAFLPSMLQAEIPYFWDFGLDTHIVFVSVLIIFLTALLTGILPAWKILNGDFNQILRDGTRGAQSKSTGRLNRILVIFEVALSCALLSASAMIAVATYQLVHADYGVKTDNMLTAVIRLPSATYPEREDQAQFFRTLVRELEQKPGVTNVSVVNPLPSEYTSFVPVEVDGFEKTKNNSNARANIVEMMPGAMEALGMELLQGRYFDDGDKADAQKVAIVTDSFVKTHMNNDLSPLGKRVRLASIEIEDPKEWATVVGVEKHVVYGQPMEPMRSRPTLFQPIEQEAWGSTRIFLQGSENVYDMVPTLNTTLYELDRNIPAFFVRPYSDLIKMNTAGIQFISDIFNLFALAALFLAGTGIYGVIANAVTRRTHELGVRRALGARDESIVQLLMRQGWKQLGMGVLLGMPLAYLIGNTVISILGGGSLTMYAMLVAMPVLIAAVVTVATYVPARRAIMLEPSVALRYE